MATLTITLTGASSQLVNLPADVATVNVQLVGGGGNGGTITGSTGRSGGGAGGAYCGNAALGVTVNTVYNLASGAPGADAVLQVNGGADLMRAKGGGTAPAPGSGAGGAGGTHTTGSTAGTGGTVSQGGDGGAGCASSGQAGGGGGGAGGPTGAGSTGTAGTAGPSAGGGAGGAGGGTVNGGTGHGGQGGGTTNAENSLNAGQTNYGSGGGGITRTSSGTASGGAGQSGIAILTYTTALPYVVQTLRGGSVASGGTVSLAAIGTGNTVVAMLTSNDGTGSIVSATLGGVAGRKIAGASQPYSAGVSALGETWVGENVTGAPTALVVTTSGGTQTGYAVSVWEVGNPGTVSPGQTVVYYTSGAATITPAAPVNGALELVGCADVGAHSLSTFQTVPAAPWAANGITGAQFIVGASWPVSGTTSQTASWTDNATTAEKTIMAVVVNPKASRSAHAIIGQ